MKYITKILAVLLSITMSVTMIPQKLLIDSAWADSVEPYVISEGRMVYASSYKDNNIPENAVDGSDTSRWESQWGIDTQWFYVDLGKVTQITGILINWKGAYAKEYKIQFSDDEENWTNVYTTSACKGGIEDLNISGNARYVKIYMTKRALTAYGYSFNEFKIYGLDGVTKRPINYGENLALDKPATSSGVRLSDGSTDDTKVKAANAVDGDMSSKWLSTYSDNQWLCVDLEQVYEIGRIIIHWASDSGKIYDVQLSKDGQEWDTVYRQLKGYSGEQANIPLYGKARYIRIYGYTRVNTGNGFAINELEVYPYKTGDEKTIYDIEEIPQLEVKQSPEGKGSYVTSAIYLEKAKLPVYKSDSVSVPIATNDWWQSSIMQKFGNLMCIMPLKAKYSTKGLEVLTGTSGWLPTPGETAVNFSVKSETLTDLSFLPENINTKEAYDRVSGNGDYSATIDLCDDSGVLMSTTYVKGCPYLFSELGKTKTIYMSVQNLVKFFGDSGKEILKAGESIETDHIGVMVTDNDNKDKTYTSTSYYCINFPEGTKLRNTGGKVVINFSTDNRYMSVGTMTSVNDLNTFYQHGYAFVTDTKVSYWYDEQSAEMTSYYEVETSNKRNGFSAVTMQCMLPHQWKKSADDDRAEYTYTSVRGDMKCVVSNKFSTTDKFSGIIPTFAMPTNEEFDGAKIDVYLNMLEGATSKLTPSSDAYWEGKNVHPLAMGALMADQIGNTRLRDTFLNRLKKILVNWFHYDGESDKSFFIYDEHWGTLYYKQSEFGANTSIADHHFTYGYFMFGASVLSNYDKEFYHEYKGMIELLARDYANYSDDDEMFCRFRNYDMYEGHSWAGGYANNDSGNNQESASEALFSWAGMYLWGIVSGNNQYRDAGIFGFTNEIQAVKQYWFDYDKDNWIQEWPYQVVSQVYGGTNFFGTFFGGQPLYCYGIQWLPVGEYLTSYGMEQDRCAEIYQGLLDDTETAIQKSQLSAANNGKSEEEIEAIRKNYKTPDNGWQHITWSYLSMTNPQLALNKFITGDTSVQKTDQANTYWYINSMKESGYKVSDIYATGAVAATVYYNKDTKKYTSMVWNPTDKVQLVTYRNNGAKIGEIRVSSHSLLKFEIPKTNNFKFSQVEAPAFTTRGCNDGNVNNNVSGQVTYDDNQYVEITCEDSDAVIHYTTDGTVPTKSSPIYSEPILISADTVIKTYSEKNGSIDSPYRSLDIQIEGTKVTQDVNLAEGKKAVSSSDENNKTLVAANITDGDKATRWSSKFTDDQWCYIDLEEVYPINTVVINWQNSYGKQYEIQVSQDGNHWTTVAEVENNSSGEKVTSFEAVQARYVKMQGIQRSNVYGYSIWEMEVYEANVAEPPTISMTDVYPKTKRVILNTPVKGAVVKYTLDGSEPTVDSAVYVRPLEITEPCEIKAITYRKGMVLSEVISAWIEPVEVPAPSTTQPVTTKPVIETTKRIESTMRTETAGVTKKTGVEANPRKVPKVKIKKVKRFHNGKKVKLLLKKVSKVSGYQVKISVTKKFKRKKTRTIKSVKTKFIVSRLKRNKKYYVKVRAYAIVGKKKVYGKWSKVKKISK